MDELDNRKIYKRFMYVLCMEKRTTIQIEHETLEKMKKIRITKKETYDEIINRLMKLAKKHDNSI